ncbi:MAG TPA: substrate-binding domain-containing protein [Gemmataceae bacterium]|nr:substrate-binding domain-containing protein [Gemmataceae bacterium]
MTGTVRRLAGILKPLVAGLACLITGCQEPAEGLRIVVIPKGLTHEFWQSIHRGALRAAEDLAREGEQVQIIWDGPLRERDMMEQIQIVDRRVATRADGIVLAPQHSQIMSAAVRRARREGVPVVVIDSGLADRDQIVKYVATDNYSGGWMAAERLAEVLTAEGQTEPKMILLRYAIGSESTEMREQGFLDFFDPAKTNPRRPRTGPPPKVEWLDTGHYAGATRDSAARAAGPLVQQYADRVDAIFAPNESSASGTLDVLRSQGLNMASREPGRKVHLMAFDSSKPLLGAIEAGDVDGSIIQDPYYMGYLGVYTLVRHIRGYDVSKGRKELDQSTGEYLVTKENVRAVATLEKFDPEYQRRRAMTPPIFPRN